MSGLYRVINSRAEEIFVLGGGVCEWHFIQFDIMRMNYCCRVLSSMNGFVVAVWPYFGGWRGVFFKKNLYQNIQKLNQKIVFTFNKKSYLCLLMCACNAFGVSFWRWKWRTSLVKKGRRNVQRRKSQGWKSVKAKI